MAAYRRLGGIVERRASEPAIVGNKAERLDQVDRHAETRGDAQQSTGILRNVWFEQRETQSGTVTLAKPGGSIVPNALDIGAPGGRFAANLCGSLSHSSADSSV